MERAYWDKTLNKWIDPSGSEKNIYESIRPASTMPPQNGNNYGSLPPQSTDIYNPQDGSVRTREEVMRMGKERLDVAYQRMSEAENPQNNYTFKEFQERADAYVEVLRDNAEYAKTGIYPVAPLNRSDEVQQDGSMQKKLIIAFLVIAIIAIIAVSVYYYFSKKSTFVRKPYARYPRPASFIMT